MCVNVCLITDQHRVGLFNESISARLLNILAIFSIFVCRYQTYLYLSIVDEQTIKTNAPYKSEKQKIKGARRTDLIHALRYHLHTLCD